MSRDGEDGGGEQAPRVPALSRGILALVRQNWLAKTPCLGPLTVLPPLALFECPRGSSESQLQALRQKPFTRGLSVLSLFPLMNSLRSAVS